MCSPPSDLQQKRKVNSGLCLIPNQGLHLPFVTVSLERILHPLCFLLGIWKSKYQHISEASGSPAVWLLCRLLLWGSMFCLVSLAVGASTPCFCKKEEQGSSAPSTTHALVSHAEYSTWMLSCAFCFTFSEIKHKEGRYSIYTCACWKWGKW